MVAGVGTKAKIGHNAAVRAVLRANRISAAVRSTQDASETVVLGYDRKYADLLMDKLREARGIASMRRMSTAGVDTIRIAWR
jgi:hypothetical protein